MSALKQARRVVRYIWNEPSNSGERGSRLVRGAVWQLRKRLCHRPVPVRLWNGCEFLADPADDMASFAVYARVFDSAHTLFAATASEDGLMADVGANVGLFTLQLCHRFDGGVLFEASPEAARKAAENVTRNRLDGFSVQATAIGDAEGHIRFLAERGTGLTSRILAADEPASGPVEEVPVTTLDRALPDHAKRRLSFLKIDVEGAKAQVFAGARETLAVAPALLILFERLKRTPLEPLTALLAEAGYIVFALSDGAPSRDEMHIRRAHDLFACRAERFDAVVRKTADAQA